MTSIRHFLVAVAAIVLIAGCIVGAHAGNTIFFSSQKGDIVFPFTPPTSSGGAGAIDNMTIGATTARPATITNLVVTGTVSGASLNSLTSPGPIGSVTPGTGAFSTLTTTGTVTASDMVVSAAGAPAIGSGNCGATTNGTVAGTNQSGLISIGSATTTTCQVDFSKTLGAAPNACVVFPANATAAAAGTTVARVSAITSAHFIVTGSALASANYYFFCL